MQETANWSPDPCGLSHTMRIAAPAEMSIRIVKSACPCKRVGSRSQGHGRIFPYPWWIVCLGHTENRQQLKTIGTGKQISKKLLAPEHYSKYDSKLSDCNFSTAEAYHSTCIWNLDLIITINSTALQKLIRNNKQHKLEWIKRCYIKQ